jgi:malignant T-cell-amplified sequence
LTFNRSLQHSNLYSVKHKKVNPETGKEEDVWDHVFYEYTEGPGSPMILIPHLRLVHQYPKAFPNRIRIDRGAIRFVLSGATLMVPGLTSPGGRLPGESYKDGEGEEEGYRYGTEDLPAGTIVVVEAEGKNHACMIGPLKMGTKEMKETKKGVAIDMGHYLGDGTWPMPAAPS